MERTLICPSTLLFQYGSLEEYILGIDFSFSGNYEIIECAYIIEARNISMCILFHPQKYESPKRSDRGV